MKYFTILAYLIPKFWYEFDTQLTQLWYAFNETMKTKKELGMIWLSGMDVQLIVVAGLGLAVALLIYILKESLR